MFHALDLHPAPVIARWSDSLDLALRQLGAATQWVPLAEIEPMLEMPVIVEILMHELAGLYMLSFRVPDNKVPLLDGAFGFERVILERMLLEPHARLRHPKFIYSLEESAEAQRRGRGARKSLFDWSRPQCPGRGAKIQDTLARLAPPEGAVVLLSCRNAPLGPAVVYRIEDELARISTGRLRPLRVVVSCSQRGSESSRLDSAVQLGESLAALGSPLEVLVLDAALGGAALLALRAERLVMMPGSRVGGCAFASLSVTCPDRPEDLLRAAIGQRAGDASALIESLLAEGKPRGLSQGELARLGVVSVSPGAEEATILERIAREARGDRLEVVRGEGQEGGAR